MQTDPFPDPPMPLRPVFIPMTSAHEDWEALIERVEAGHDFQAQSDMEKRYLFAAHDRIAAGLSFDPVSVTPSQLQAWIWVCSDDVFEQIVLTSALHSLLFQAIVTGQRNPTHAFEIPDFPHPALVH